MAASDPGRARTAGVCHALSQAAAAQPGVTGMSDRKFNYLTQLASLSSVTPGPPGSMVSWPGNYDPHDHDTSGRSS